MTQSVILWRGTITALANGDSYSANLNDAEGRSGKLNFAEYDELFISVYLKTLSGGTSPTVQVLISTSDMASDIGGTDTWYNLNSTAPTWTGSGNQYLASAGPGTGNNNSIGIRGRITYNITGSPTSVLIYVTIIGKRYG